MTETTGRRLELYLRDETRGRSGEQQTAVRGRVVDLAATPLVNAVETYDWPRKIAIDGTGPTDDRAREAFNAFSRWARERDARIYPAFGTRDCFDRDTGEQYTALVLPVMALAVYENDVLEAVYPHRDGERVVTVFDGLADIETDGRSTPDDEDRRPVPAG
ncbi:HTH domain-containing protein [Halorientalis brevis]|uniref:HTH domain-containing protein n=1 Tax=Halorientalis brevis TaxID=1126241 RepID=A0ABD6CES1_9EURY|nr:HTH domain-containing protein [Halorientalis brevis]